MKNKRCYRMLISLAAVMLCMTAFSIPAYAGGTEPAEQPETEQPQETALPADPVPLTPEGNLSLVDDIDGEASDDKQFITVVSKGGNYFYIIIDRAADGENTVHFLNQVDEADLLALTEDGKTETAPALCTCSEKCEAGSVNTGCEVCSKDKSRCVGKEAAPQEPEEEPEKKSGVNPILILLTVLLLGGGGAFYYFKFVKQKSSTKGGDDLSDLDYEDEYEDTEVELIEDEPEQEEEIK